VEILLKRAYEKPGAEDGFRVLVDRLWPRGVKKTDLHLDAWAKDVAPSTQLRKWFGHDPKRWTEFCKRYKSELKNPEVQATIANTIQAARGRSAMTLIYGAKDTEHNEEIVLLPVFRRTAARESRTSPTRKSRGKAPKKEA
jgi:uncharacterized protein YeaO (DUF488 family)